MRPTSTMLLAACIIAALRANCEPRVADRTSRQPAIEVPHGVRRRRPAHRRLAFLVRQRLEPLYDSLPSDVTPHPAVARIIVPEDGATAYGSGTLVDVRDQITGWWSPTGTSCAMRTGLVEVVFPDGFRSHARPLKVDSDWDLAALVIWRPTSRAGEDRHATAAAGRPAHDSRLRPRPVPHRHRPLHDVLRAAAATFRTRWSSSTSKPGKAIRAARSSTNRGELAGVLFGAGQGTTLGSFAPRVRHFPGVRRPGYRPGKFASRRSPSPTARRRT